MIACDTEQHDNDAIGTKEAAAILGYKEATLRYWRTKGYGPPYYQHRQSVRYRRHELLQWLDAIHTTPGGVAIIPFEPRKRKASHE